MMKSTFQLKFFWDSNVWSYLILPRMFQQMSDDDDVYYQFIRTYTERLSFEHQVVEKK